jgi:hypothetical protein
LTLKNLINGEGGMMNQIEIGHTRETVVESDLRFFIEKTISTALEGAVQDVVDRELLLMVKGEGFQKRIQAMIDAELGSLVQEIAIKRSGAGPGRGHTGRSHRKISLSIPESLYLKVRELEGFFSGHVAGALELYLRLQQKRQEG